MLCSLLLIAIAPAFVIHEMAHKIVARKYGCWAEFRMSPGGLRFGVLLAAILQVVFMAPGAVMVIGNTTKSQFGKIASGRTGIKPLPLVVGDCPIGGRTRRLFRNHRFHTILLAIGQCLPRHFQHATIRPSGR